MASFSDTLTAARLSYSDLEWLSNGVLTVGKLKRHGSGTQLLSAADYALVLMILESHKNATKGIRLLALSKRKMPKAVKKPAADPSKPGKGFKHKGELAPGLAAWMARRDAAIAAEAVQKAQVA